MRIPRIYTPQPLTCGDEIELDDHARQHVVQVLRLKTDSPLILFNGEGSEYEARLNRIEKRLATVYIGEQHTPQRESPLKIHLGLGISKGERMDIAIQKSVELGVSEITPLFTERCVVQLDEKRKEKRQQHWQGVILSACEQCGRTLLPMLHSMTSYRDWIQTVDSEATKLILDPDTRVQLSDIKPTPTCIRLTIGPEGGFSEGEMELAMQHAYRGLKLGPRIMRTETAVIAGLAALQIAWGDLDTL